MCRRSWIAPILLIGLLGYAAAQSPAADTEPAVFGHLFTPAGIPDDGQPRPDPATRADALAKAEQFLKSRGFIR